MDTITTTTLGAGFAETNEYVLFETATTALVFKAQIHDGGIRGSLIRYKKDRNGNREQIIPTDFKKLNTSEGVEIKLKTEAVSRLMQRIQELQALLDEQGVRPGTHWFKVANADDLVITDQNKAEIIRKLLDASLGEEVWEQLVIANPDIATRLALSKLNSDRLRELNRFEDMLNQDNLVERDWQCFFEENNWIFGYGLKYQILGVIQAQPDYGGTAVDGQGGQRGDFLAATEAVTRFTCLVEIKKPSTRLLQMNAYRNGAWGISAELAGAISQVQVNCAQWEITGARTEHNRERMTDINTISPKGIVVIGRTNELDNYDKKNSFERIRQEVRNPEIITYDELYNRAKYIVGLPIQ